MNQKKIGNHNDSTPSAFLQNHGTPEILISGSKLITNSQDEAVKQFDKVIIIKKEAVQHKLIIHQQPNKPLTNHKTSQNRGNYTVNDDFLNERIYKPKRADRNNLRQFESTQPFNHQLEQNSCMHQLLLSNSKQNSSATALKQKSEATKALQKAYGQHKVIIQVQNGKVPTHSAQSRKRSGIQVISAWNVQHEPQDQTQDSKNMLHPMTAYTSLSGSYQSISGNKRLKKTSQNLLASGPNNQVQNFPIGQRNQIFVQAQQQDQIHSRGERQIYGQQSLYQKIMKNGDRNNYQQTDLNHLLYFQGLDDISHQSK